MSFEKQTMIIDNWSVILKAGTAGEDATRAVYLWIEGRPQHANSMHGVTTKEQYIKDEAEQKRGLLNLKYPIANGIVSDW